MEDNQKSILQKIPGFRSGRLWKKILASLVYAFVLMVVIIANTDPSTDTQPPAEQVQQEQGQEQEPQTANTGPTQEQQEAFTVFYARAMDLCDRSDKLNDALTEGEALVNSGKGSIHELYGLASTARDSSRSIWSVMGDIEIPKSLSKEHQEQLKEARSDLSTAIFCRMQAYEAYMEYLDTRRPSDANKMKESMEASSWHLMSGVAKLVTVKADLGIED